jgi:hypothetical protein
VVDLVDFSFLLHLGAGGERAIAASMGFVLSPWPSLMKSHFFFSEFSWLLPPLQVAHRVANLVDKPYTLSLRSQMMGKKGRYVGWYSPIYPAGPGRDSPCRYSI